MQNDRGLEVGQVALMDADVLPPIVKRFHEAKHQGAVDVLFGDMVGDRLEMRPLAIGILHIDVERDPAAPVGIQQGAPGLRGDAHPSGPAEDGDGGGILPADRQGVGPPFLQDPEIQRSDIGRHRHTGVVGAQIGLAANLAVRFDRLRTARGQTEEDAAEDGAEPSSCLSVDHAGIPV